MFMVGGKLSQVRELADGRIAYWRGPNIPAAVLTTSQLEEVQRLVARRLLLPYGFIVFGAGLAFLSFKSELPLAIPVVFGTIAMLICIFADISARRRIEGILSQAPAEDRLPPYIAVLSRLKALWQGSTNGYLRLLTWLTGIFAFSSALCLFSKITGLGDFDPRNEFHSFTLLVTTAAPLFLFHLCLRERRRRSIEAPPKRG